MYTTLEKVSREAPRWNLPAMAAMPRGQLGLLNYSTRTKNQLIHFYYVLFYSLTYISSIIDSEMRLALSHLDHSQFESHHHVIIIEVSAFIRITI